MDLAVFSGSLIETPDLNYAVLMKNYFPVLFSMNGGAEELVGGRSYTIRILNETREVFGLPMDTFRGQFHGKTTYSMMDGTGYPLIDRYFLMSLTGMAVEDFRKRYFDAHKTVLLEVCIFQRK